MGQAEGEDMSGAQQRGTNWTPDEDRRLFDLVEAGKSWVLISANLKRPAKTIRNRLAYLGRQTKKADLDSAVELGLSAEKWVALSPKAGLGCPLTMSNFLR
jgi:hypothetical protein